MAIKSAVLSVSDERSSLDLEGKDIKLSNSKNSASGFIDERDGYKKLKLLLEAFQNNDQDVLRVANYSYFSNLLELGEVINLRDNSLQKNGIKIISNEFGGVYLIDLMLDVFLLIKKNQTYRKLIEDEIEKPVIGGRFKYFFPKNSQLYGITLFFKISGMATYSEMSDKDGQVIFYVTINNSGIDLIQKLTAYSNDTNIPVDVSPSDEQVSTYYNRKVTLFNPSNQNSQHKNEINIIKIQNENMKLIDKSVTTGDVKEKGTVMGAGSKENRNEGFQWPKALVNTFIAILIVGALIIFWRFLNGKDTYSATYKDLEIQQQQVEK